MTNSIEERLADAMLEYGKRLLEVITLGHKETSVKLEMDVARSRLCIAKGELWALEQEAKEGRTV